MHSRTGLNSLPTTAPTVPRSGTVGALSALNAPTALGSGTLGAPHALHPGPDILIPGLTRDLIVAQVGRPMAQV